jgi:thiamine-phosphate pyrophosphorylase
VLVAPPNVAADAFAQQLEEAINGGDVASLILPQGAMQESEFQAVAERVVPVAQQAGVAAVVAGDTRIAGRVRADGIHVEDRAELARAVEHFQPKFMVGTGGAKTRHEALELGEERPDYIFFGRFGYDRTPEPHPRNLDLGRWWAEMIEIPCIVMAGSDIASVEAVAATRAEFVALSSAVFGAGLDPRRQVEEANRLLDRTAPRLEV